MKAYELAKAQQAYSPPTLEEIIKQQADRIAELEKGLELVKDAYCARDSECRQLKDRIAELEKDLHMTERHYERLCTGQNKPEKFWSNTPSFADQFKQSEPVAWMSSVNGETVYVGYEPADGYLAIPLYTAPQTKPLSDEEIIKLFWGASWGTDEDVVKFVRAIEERHGIK